jgi:hypothetical protein
VPTQTKPWSLPPPLDNDHALDRESLVLPEPPAQRSFPSFAAPALSNFRWLLNFWLNQPRDGSPTSAQGRIVKKGLRLIGSILVRDGGEQSPNSIACSSFSRVASRGNALTIEPVNAGYLRLERSYLGCCYGMASLEKDFML